MQSMMKSPEEENYLLLTTGESLTKRYRHWSRDNSTLPWQLCTSSKVTIYFLPKYSPPPMHHNQTVCIVFFFRFCFKISISSKLKCIALFSLCGELITIMKAVILYISSRYHPGAVYRNIKSMLLKLSFPPTLLSGDYDLFTFLDSA